MTQQTAVSFLLRELRIEDLAKGEQLSVVLQICEQAKQMEKEQIMKAVKDSWYMAKGSNFQYPQEEQYYNETYNK